MVCHHMAEGGFCPCGTRLSLAGMPQAGVQSRSICTWMASTILFTSTSFTTVEALMTAIWIMGPPPVRLVRCAVASGKGAAWAGLGKHIHDRSPGRRSPRDLLHDPSRVRYGAASRVSRDAFAAPPPKGRCAYCGERSPSAERGRPPESES